MATEENTPERWLPVVGFEGAYEVSDFGRVRGLDRITTWKDGTHPRLRPGKLIAPRNMIGYVTVNLAVSGRSTQQLIHRLVLTAFVRPPLIGEVCNHLDFSRSNNRLHNLEWTTQAENMRHAHRGGHIPNGERLPQHKLTADQVVEIRKLHASGSMTKDLSKSFGVGLPAISAITRGRNWKHLL